MVLKQSVFFSHKEKKILDLNHLGFVRLLRSDQQSGGAEG